MAKPKERKLVLIDKNELIKSIEYNAFIGGEERLLSRTEVVALIEREHVWDEKNIQVLRI